MDGTKSGTQELTTKALAVVGVIAVLLIGMWLAVAAVRMAPAFVSSLASAFVSMTSIFTPAERVEIALSENTLSHKVPVTLSWNHVNKNTEGSYVFSYFCGGDLYFTAKKTPETPEEKIFCNTPFSFVSKENELVLTPYLGKDTETTLIMTFTPNGETTSTLRTERAVRVIAGNGTVTEGTTTGGTSSGTGTTGSGTGTTITGTPSTNIYQITGTSTRPSNPNGTIDLRVKVLAIGYVNRTTGEFTATSSVRVMDRAAIKFEVENIGTKTSTPWSFNILLPTLPFHVFTSSQQIPLTPGDKIEYTLGFDNIENQRIVSTLINIDPTNQVYDIDRSNNTARQTFTVYEI